MNTKVTLAVESVNEMRRTVENVVLMKYQIIHTCIVRGLQWQFVSATDATGSIRHEKQDEAVRGGNEEDTASDEPRRGARESSENTLQIDDAN